jgi:hypothetical protein
VEARNGVGGELLPGLDAGARTREEEHGRGHDHTATTHGCAYLRFCPLHARMPWFNALAPAPI